MFDRIVIQHHIQITTIFWTGVGNFVGGKFLPAQGTSIAHEFVHALILPDVQADQICLYEMSKTKEDTQA